MKKLSYCIWPHALNPDTSVSVRIGRSIHWLLAAIGSAAILLGLAMVARAYLIDPAAAQDTSVEGDAFKAADPGTQRAIINMRAIHEEVRKQEGQARTSSDDPYTRALAELEARKHAAGAPAVPRNSAPRPTASGSGNLFDLVEAKGEAEAAGRARAAGLPDYVFEQYMQAAREHLRSYRPQPDPADEVVFDHIVRGEAISEDEAFFCVPPKPRWAGDKCVDEASYKAARASYEAARQESLAKLAAEHRLQEAIPGLKFIIAGLLLVFVGRASRYVLSKE